MFRILDTHMHVHAADHEPVGQRLHVLRENIIVAFICVPLDRPIGERMGRRGDNFHPVTLGDLRHCAPQYLQLCSRFVYGVTDRGADFDLTAQKFWAHAADIRIDRRFAILENIVRRVGD